MTPSRPIVPPVVRAATLLSLGALALAGGLLAGCGRHRRVVRLEPDADELAQTASTGSKSATATPPPTVIYVPVQVLVPVPAPTVAPEAPAPSRPIDLQRARDLVGETLEAYDRRERERVRQKREAAGDRAASGGTSGTLEAASGQVFQTPFPQLPDVQSRLR